MKVLAKNLRPGDVFLDDDLNAIVVDRVENVYVEVITNDGYMQFTQDEPLDIVRRAPRKKSDK